MRYRLKVLRAMADMTQDQLAKKAGCSRQFIVSLESDDPPNTTVDMLMRIAAVFHCRVEDLFFSDDSLPTVDKTER